MNDERFHDSTSTPGGGMTRVDVLAAVRAGYAAGLCLLPCKEDGSKIPDLLSWLEFKTTRPTRDQMRKWNFTQRSGYGMVSGAVSGGVMAVDFDCPETYAAMMAGAPLCGLEDVLTRIAD